MTFDEIYRLATVSIPVFIYPYLAFRLYQNRNEGFIPRHSVLGLIILNGITLDAYALYWYLNVTIRVNKVSGRKIPNGKIYCGISMHMILVLYMYLQNALIDALGERVYYQVYLFLYYPMLLIVYAYWALEIKSRFEDTNRNFSSFYTIIFGYLYLQYVLNMNYLHEKFDLKK